MNKLESWRLLRLLALGDSETGEATITLTDREDEAQLIWPDGSVCTVRWRDGYGWEFLGSLSSCPGDVAARDSL